MFDEVRLPRHPLMQDPAFAQALRLCGQSPVALPGGLTLLQRRIGGVRICMLPRAVPPEDLAEQLRHVGLHRAPLILSPEKGGRVPRGLRLRKPREGAVWEVDEAKETCRARLHPKWRNQLKRAEAQELTITRHRLAPDPDGYVLRTATRQARSRGYTCWPAPLTAAFAAVAPEQTHLFRATFEGRDIAHMLFLTHGGSATYQIGHTTPEGKERGAHNLLLWRAARHFARASITQIDLGLIDGQSPGLDRFKLRTGAARVKTGGTYLYWRPFARG